MFPHSVASGTIGMHACMHATAGLTRYSIILCFLPSHSLYIPLIMSFQRQSKLSITTYTVLFIGWDNYERFVVPVAMLIDEASETPFEKKYCLVSGTKVKDRRVGKGGM